MKKMYVRKTTQSTARAITFILAAAAVVTANNKGIKHTLLVRYYKPARTVRSTSKASVSSFTSRATNIQNLHILSLRLKIYALHESQTKQETATILVAAAGQKAATLQADTLDKATAAIKGASYGHAASALITDFYEMLESINNAKTAYCVTGTPDSTDAAGSTETEGCAHAAAADFEAGTFHHCNELIQTVFEDGDPISTPDGNATKTKFGFFTGTANQETNTGFPTGTPKIDKVKKINGLFKLNAASDPTTPAITNIETAVGGGINKFWKDLHTATKDVFHETDRPGNGSIQKTLIAIGSKTSVEQHIRNFLAAANNTSPKSVKGDIDAEYKQKIGENNEETDKLWTQLKTTRVVNPEKDYG
uniref:Variant surface glycoprotein 1564 n=1 Tax=Trypanosoma brucei TaxID=5691 RepID=M4SVQ1_9TRYP|nr:variant surface glycoprotein 1564 [Trypanosoma brucei]